MVRAETIAIQVRRLLMTRCIELDDDSELEPFGSIVTESIVLPSFLHP